MANSENASRNILNEGLKIYRQGLSITKVEDKSDYLGSTSVETRSPTHQLCCGWVVHDVVFDKDGRFWINHKDVGSGEPLKQWIDGVLNVR